MLFFYLCFGNLREMIYSYSKLCCCCWQRSSIRSLTDCLTDWQNESCSRFFPHSPSSCSTSHAMIRFRNTCAKHFPRHQIVLVAVAVAAAASPCFMQHQSGTHWERKRQRECDAHFLHLHYNDKLQPKCVSENFLILFQLVFFLVEFCS